MVPSRRLPPAGSQIRTDSTEHPDQTGHVLRERERLLFPFSDDDGDTEHPSVMRLLNASALQSSPAASAVPLRGAALSRMLVSGSDAFPVSGLVWGGV